MHFFHGHLWDTLKKNTALNKFKYLEIKIIHWKTEKKWYSIKGHSLVTYWRIPKIFLLNCGAPLSLILDFQPIIFTFFKNLSKILFGCFFSQGLVLILEVFLGKKPKKQALFGFGRNILILSLFMFVCLAYFGVCVWNSANKTYENKISIYWREPFSKIENNSVRSIWWTTSFFGFFFFGSIREFISLSKLFIYQQKPPNNCSLLWTNLYFKSKSNLQIEQPNWHWDT